MEEGGWFFVCEKWQLREEERPGGTFSQDALAKGHSQLHVRFQPASSEFTRTGSFSICNNTNQ